MQTLGERIREARTKAGLAQVDLANAVGVRLQTISMWERDRTVPRVDQVQSIALRLEVPLMWLMEGNGVKGGGK